MRSINYTVEEIPKSVDGDERPSNIRIILKQGYQNPRHINRVNNEIFDNSRRDLFSAYINAEHPDKTIHGYTVFIRRISLNSPVPNSMSRRQCWACRVLKP